MCCGNVQKKKISIQLGGGKCKGLCKQNVGKDSSMRIIKDVCLNNYPFFIKLTNIVSLKDDVKEW